MGTTKTGMYTNKDGMLFQYTLRKEQEQQDRDYLEDALQLLRDDSELQLLNSSTDQLLKEAEACVAEAPTELKIPPVPGLQPASTLEGQFWGLLDQIDSTLRDATSSAGAKDDMIKVVEDAKAKLQAASVTHQRRLCHLEQAKQACDVQLGTLLAKQACKPHNAVANNQEAKIHACKLKLTKSTKDPRHMSANDIRDKLLDLQTQMRTTVAAQKQIQRLLSVFSVLKIYNTRRRLKRRAKLELVEV